MKRGFYLKLALTGIRKTKDYIRHIFDLHRHGDDVLCGHLLSNCQVLEKHAGWNDPAKYVEFWQLGDWNFRSDFLFYTNFLIRRRKKSLTV